MTHPIITRLNRILTRNQPAPPELPAHAPDLSLTMGLFQSIQAQWSVSAERTAKYSDYDLMDRDELSSMLNAVVDSALMSDDGRMFTFEVSVKGRAPRKIIDQCLQDIDLRDTISEHLRSLLKYGDLFLELVPDRGGNVRRLKRLPAAQMHRNEDQYGVLPTGTDKDGHPLAYTQRSDAGKVTAAFFPWEIVHATWQRNGRYGESFLEKHRATWKKIQAVEEALVMNRLFRSFARHVHYIDVTGKNDVQARKILDDYKRELSFRRLQNSQMKQNPFEVLTDFFVTTGHRQDGEGKTTPVLSKIELLDPSNTAIGELGDVGYFRSKMFTDVGAESFGVDNNQKPGVTDQDLLTSRIYRRAQEKVRQIVRGVLDVQLALKGYAPGQVEYEVVLPRISTRANWLYADSLFRLALTAKTLDQMGAIDRRTAINMIMSITDEEFEEMLANRQREDELFPRPEPEKGNDNMDQVINGNQSTDTGGK